MGRMYTQDHPTMFSLWLDLWEEPVEAGSQLVHDPLRLELAPLNANRFLSESFRQVS
jgi:hypothetical protein